MKFLQVYCENRKSPVFINIEKVVLISKIYDEESGQEFSSIELDGLEDKGAVKVNSAPEDLIRMINGDDKVRIGFRTSN